MSFTVCRRSRDLNLDIATAIRDRRRLRFLYHGKPRLVEPQCHGIGTRGTELLRAHQIEGGEQPEPLFDVGQMEGLIMLDHRIDHPAPHYRRNDIAFATIYSQL